MAMVKIIYKDGSYCFKGSTDYQMAIVGQFLVKDFCCFKKISLRDWALDAWSLEGVKVSPTIRLSFCIEKEVSCLKGDKDCLLFITMDYDGFIYITMDYEREILKSNSIKMSQQQFVQLLDDWQEKVCKPKPKEVFVEYENNQFTIETETKRLIAWENEH